MRLTHLKLAGFKSFVDATTLHLHGQRVGVVGPNGCGKSNVMESVRWVLGESSAKELRGDSMDAVIFNGSENRKPISRASVELIFDNSLGNAAGEWSQYAEISVKRVIEREKGSTYYINNTVVRKRDVADLFLGTGLGGRAYAIIGQNTINRIVEAKPEELRVFLEEAAGISKYKERRRETELRLRDTRENLIRVEDLLREIEKQIERLEGQAVVAQEYQTLQVALTHTKGQIWLLKKNEANDRWQKSQRLVEKLVNDLEAQVANLRHNENALETARQNHIAASDKVSAAQTQYYEINTEVSSLESQIKSIQSSNERMKVQEQQLQVQTSKNVEQREQVGATLAHALDKQAQLQQDYLASEQAIEEAKAQFSEYSQTFHSILEAFNNRLSTLNQAEQTLKIEQTNVQHLQKSFNDMQSQVERLAEQLANITMPDEAVIEALENQIAEVQAQTLDLESMLHEGQAEEQAVGEQIKIVRDQQQTLQKQLHTIEAQVASLDKMQQSIRTGNQAGELTEWLRRENLTDKSRLWQTIRIEQGWEQALESALSGRLNAIIDDRLSHASRAPNALTVMNAAVGANQVEATQFNSSATSIMTLVEFTDEAVKPIVEDWLSGVYVAETVSEALEQLRGLSAGECIVTKDGDQYTQNSVTYFGPQSALHGVMERQAELEHLQAEQPAVQAGVLETQAVIDDMEANLQGLRARTRALGGEIKTLTQSSHQLTLSLQQHQQQKQNAFTRKAALVQEHQLAQDKLQKIDMDLNEKQAQVEEYAININALRMQKQDHEREKNVAETVRNQSRSQLQYLEKQYQEKNYEIKLGNNSIKDLKEKLDFLNQEYEMLQARHEELLEALTLADVTNYLADFEHALNKKQVAEVALNESRNEHSECEAALHELEKSRMQSEHQLYPLRDKLEASRLADQEARLQFEQCQQAVAMCGTPEELLAYQLGQLNDGRGHRPVTAKELESKEENLNKHIDALGAVNLAALEELKAEKTRRDLIVEQMRDLTEASETLEGAIKKIDRETRGRLQVTFETVNRNFAELFSTLFNGGQARLELLGDEILDTGMQVFAQPPGKKNSTIHLLSGGEKALTAIALVFALFKLNPAPFCLMDEVDAPLDDSNTERFCKMVQKMSENTQFMYVSHNKITMEMAQQLIGVTMQESGVSRIVDVDMEEAVKMVAV